MNREESKQEQILSAQRKQHPHLGPSGWPPMNKKRDDTISTERIQGRENAPHVGESSVNFNQTEDHDWVVL